MTFVDASRRVRFPGRAPAPRKLVTLLRYPARGAASQIDIPNAAPERAAEPFPLVIVADGFAVTPAPYSRLLETWARAGYVVAGPAFQPREQTGEPRRSRPQLAPWAAHGVLPHHHR